MNSKTTGKQKAILHFREESPLSHLFKRKADCNFNERVKRRKFDDSTKPKTNFVKTRSAHGSTWLQKDSDLDEIIQRRRNETVIERSCRKKVDRTKSPSIRKRKISHRTTAGDPHRYRFPPLKFAAPTEDKLPAQNVQKVTIGKKTLPEAPMLVPETAISRNPVISSPKDTQHSTIKDYFIVRKHRDDESRRFTEVRVEGDKCEDSDKNDDCNKLEKFLPKILEKKYDENHFEDLSSSESECDFEKEKVSGSECERERASDSECERERASDSECEREKVSGSECERERASDSECEREKVSGSEFERERASDSEYEREKVSVSECESDSSTQPLSFGCESTQLLSEHATASEMNENMPTSSKSKETKDAQTTEIPKLRRLFASFHENNKNEDEDKSVKNESKDEKTVLEIRPVRLSKRRQSDRGEYKSRPKIILVADSPENEYGMSNYDRRMKEMLLREADEFQRDEATVAFRTNHSWIR